jgi:hypothetical protein
MYGAGEFVHKRIHLLPNIGSSQSMLSLANCCIPHGPQEMLSSPSRPSNNKSKLAQRLIINKQHLSRNSQVIHSIYYEAESAAWRFIVSSNDASSGTCGEETPARGGDSLGHRKIRGTREASVSIAATPWLRSVGARTDPRHRGLLLSLLCLPDHNRVSACFTRLC